MTNGKTPKPQKYKDSEDIQIIVSGNSFMVLFDLADGWFAVQDHDPDWYDEMGNVCLTAKNDLDDLISSLQSVKHYFEMGTVDIDA